MHSRRQFIKSGASAAAMAMLPAPFLHASIAVMTETAPGASHSYSRHRLSSGWEFLRGSLGGPWEVWNSDEVAVFEPVTMPHCFNSYDGCDPDVPYYRGNGWYRTHVKTANPYKNGRTLLHFEGAGQTTSVYVGEKLAGVHTGGYDEFVLDITDLIASLELAETSAAPAMEKRLAGVPIAVLCDNSRDLDRIPSDLSDFSLYGGLYRQVNLVYVPTISLETMHVQTTLESPRGSAEISIVGTLYNPTHSTEAVKIAVQVLNAKSEVVHHSTHTMKPWDAATEIVSFRIARPEAWSPATPHLYECRLSLGTTESEYVTHEQFGVRHTEFVEHGPFKLNGERVLLRGTHRHEDHAGYAAAMPDDLLAQEMHLIKKMGANFIRLAHYQQSRRVLEHCDRLGILVWEEIPWCRSGVGNEMFKDMARRTLHNMISQHYNHPSVVLWGLGNEDDWPNEYPETNVENIREFMQELNTLSHDLDPSRMTSVRRCDFARDIPDVYSPSIWAGWYRGTYQEYEKSLETERERVKRLIHVEWGADSHAGRHSEDPDKVLAKITAGRGTDERHTDYLPFGGQARVSKDGDWSETYACNLFDWYLKVQETLPWLTGSAQWIFKDFTTPLRVENPVPRINQKGVIQRDMTLKESYYVFQSYWTDEPMAHIYGHTWPVRWGEANEMKMVKVYSNCDQAELFINSKSVGVKQRDSQDFPAAGLRWACVFASGKNHLKVIANRHGKKVVDEIEFIYQIEKWGAAAKLILTEKSRAAASGQDTVTLEAKLYDEKNVLCLDARNQVRFSVAGKSTLIDNQGTSRGSRVVQLYNGRAEITLVRNGGTSTVAVSAEGLPTSFCLVT